MAEETRPSGNRWHVSGTCDQSNTFIIHGGEGAGAYPSHVWKQDELPAPCGACLSIWLGTQVSKVAPLLLPALLLAFVVQQLTCEPRHPQSPTPSFQPSPQVAVSRCRFFLVISGGHAKAKVSGSGRKHKVLPHDQSASKSRSLCQWDRQFFHEGYNLQDFSFSATYQEYQCLPLPMSANRCFI